MRDILNANHVEISTDSTGKLCINVDNECALRIEKVATLQLNIGEDQYVSLTKGKRLIVTRHQAGDGVTCWCGKNHAGRYRQVKQARPFIPRICPKN